MDKVMAWTAALIIVILAIVRAIIYGVRTIHQDRINRRFNRIALQKAHSRRGNFRNRQGYSGASRPIVEEEYKPEKMASEEISRVVDNAHENAEGGKKKRRRS